MRPLHQSITMPGPLPEGLNGEELVDAGIVAPGDCMRACVASILELELDRVPHFAAYRRCVGTPAHLWWWALVGWCHSEADIDLTFQPSTEPPSGWSIAEGDGPRGYGHVTVAYDGVTVHDPHPSGDGLVVLTGYYAFEGRSITAKRVLRRPNEAEQISDRTAELYAARTVTA